MLTKEALLTESEVKALKNLVEIYPETFFQGTPAMEKKSAKSVLKSIK